MEDERQKPHNAQTELAGLGFTFAPVQLPKSSRPRPRSGGGDCGGAPTRPAAKAVGFSLRERQPGPAYSSPPQHSSGAGQLAGPGGQPTQRTTAAGLARLKLASLAARRRAAPQGATALPPSPQRGPEDSQPSEADPASCGVGISQQQADLLEEAEAALAGCSPGAAAEQQAAVPPLHLLLGHIPVHPLPPARGEHDGTDGSESLGPCTSLEAGAAQQALVPTYWMPGSETASERLRAGPAAAAVAAGWGLAERPEVCNAAFCAGASALRHAYGSEPGNASTVLAAEAGIRQCVGNLAVQQHTQGQPPQQQLASSQQEHQQLLNHQSPREPEADDCFEASEPEVEAPERLEDAMQLLGLLPQPAAPDGGDEGGGAAVTQGRPAPRLPAPHLAWPLWALFRAAHVVLVAKQAAQREGLLPILRRLRQASLQLEFHRVGGEGRFWLHIL